MTPPSEEIRAWSERQMELAEKARRLEDSQLTYSERLMQTANLSKSITRLAKAGEAARKS